MPSMFRGSIHPNRMNDSHRTHLPSVRISPLEYTSETFTTISNLAGRQVHLTPQDHTMERHYDHDQHAGAEPGVNPRSGDSIAEYSHFKQDCVIDVVEYDCDDVTFQRFTNAGLVNLLNNNGVNGFRANSGMPLRMVRWINIGGIDWSILSALALRYNLHSLALEDILHERGHTHSKADYYSGHLFIRVLCHTLGLPHYDVRPANELPQYGEDVPVPTNIFCDVSDDPIIKKLDVEEGGMHHSLDSSTMHIVPDKNADGVEASEILESGSQTARGKGKIVAQSFLPSSLRKRLTGLSGFGGPSRNEKRRQIRALTAGDRVFVNHHPMFIFLLHDGTVISIHPTLNLQYTAPIAERLHHADSVLRTSEDASLLVESLLDLAVDRVLEIVDEYQVKIDKLEHDILLNPVMRSVRSRKPPKSYESSTDANDHATVHILSGDLIMHKRTLEPIRTMIYGLRRYDLERSRALADNIALETGTSSDTDSPDTEGKKSGKQTVDKSKSSTMRSQARKRKRRLKQLFQEEYFAKHGDDPKSSVYEEDNTASHKNGHSGYPTKHHRSLDQEKINRAKQGGAKVQGYFSYKAKVYLADVSDHMDFALTSIDMFAGISENLINYAFNVASYEMNIVMNRLTLATIIFLPLTLLTGYFGMNFTRFWSVEDHSDVFFWTIAIPVMLVLVPIFMYDDIRKAVSYMRRRHDSVRAVDI